MSESINGEKDQSCLNKNSGKFPSFPIIAAVSLTVVVFIYFVGHYFLAGLAHSKVESRLLLAVAVLLMLALAAWLAAIYILSNSRKKLLFHIAEKERATDALRQSETRLRALFENANDIIFTCDLQGNFNSVNKLGERLSGYSREEFVKLNFVQIIAPEYMEFVALMMSEKMTTNAPTVYEAELIKKDGSRVRLDINSRLIVEGGEAIGIHGIARDITESQQAAENRRKSEQYQNLFRHANDAILIIEPTSEKVVNANAKACEMYGFTPEEFIGRSVKSLSKNVGHGEQQLDQLLAQGTYQEFETVQLRADGTPMNLVINASVIEYEGQNAILSINRDVTARKKMEMDLRERGQHLLAVTNSAQDAIISADHRGSIIFWNDGARKIFGYQEKEIVGKSLTVLMPKNYRQRYALRIRRLIETGEQQVAGSVELCGLHRDGTEFPLELSLGVWETEQGKNFTGIMRDISDRKRAEEIIARRARETALRADIGAIFTESKSSLQSSLTRCAEAVVKHLDTAFARIWTLNDEEKMLELQASAGIYTHINGAHARVPIGKFKIGWIAQEQKPHITNEVPNDRRVSDPEWARANGLIAFAGFPMIIEGKLIGVIAAFSRHKFNEDVLETLASIGSSIAQSIQRCRAEERLRESEQQYRFLGEGIMHQVWTAQPNGEIDYANQRAIDYFDRPSGESLGKSWSRAIHPEDFPLCAERWAKSLKSGAAYEAEFRLKDKTGVYRWHLGRATAGMNAAGTVVKWFGTNTDIDGKKYAEAELQKNLALLTSTFEATADGLLVVNADNEIEIYNQKFLEMWNLSETILKSWLSAETPQYILEQIKNPAEYIKKTAQISVCDLANSFDEIELKNGRIYERCSRPQKLNNQVIGRVFSFRDVTTRKRAEHQLLHDAFHDGLTGLANRTRFMDHLRMTIERSRRPPANLYAVLFLDFDRFKIINDNLGHAEGDKLLKQIAERLEAATRTGDLVARLGGDEFVILLNEMADGDDAVQITKRIQNTLKMPFDLIGGKVFISASIGIALGSSEQQRAEDMLRDADIAMYRAKAKGKAQYQIFDSAMHAQASQKLSLETEMRQALEHGEFEMHYQPIINLETERLLGFEALVRWQHPERGLISPFEFIPAAEENGLILPLGNWILRESCGQLRRWQTANLATDNLTMSVNLSTKQFSQSDLAEKIAVMLEVCGLDPRCLKLEITESHVMENSDSAVKMMNKLRGLGVEISLDDFGTGYSSLSYLHRLPVNYLKIDRSFVMRMTESEENSEIVLTIIKLAQNLKMKVIAEGVETAEQLAHLKFLGCEFGQGYFFAKPLAANLAEQFIVRASENSPRLPHTAISGADLSASTDSAF